ncbi:MAG TPA: hypothetical protein VF715_06150 [Thermoleophilaceae bacterium]|jgi:hypothetical protein
MPIIYLRAFNGLFVHAYNGGGGSLQALVDPALEWESFTVPGNLASGAVVTLKTYTGHYWCAENGGGGILVANRTQALGWEQFKIIGLGMADGTPLSSGAQVAIVTPDNQWFVCAENGGQSTLNVTRRAIGGWETFRLEIGGNEPRPAYDTWRTFPTNA